MKPVIVKEQRKYKSRIAKIIPSKLHELTYPNYVLDGDKKLQLAGRFIISRVLDVSELTATHYYSTGVKSELSWRFLRAGMGYITLEDVYADLLFHQMTTQPELGYTSEEYKTVVDAYTAYGLLESIDHLRSLGVKLLKEGELHG